MMYIDWVVNALFLALGFVLGQVVQWKQKKIGRTSIAVPTVHMNSKRLDMLLALGVAIAIVGTLATAVYQQDKDKRCMEELWSAMEARSDASDAARKGTRELAEGLITHIQLPEVERQAAYQELTDEYTRTMREAEERLERTRLTEQEHC